MTPDHAELLNKFTTKVDACMQDFTTHVLEETAQIENLETRFDSHLQIYANNGKELMAVKVNQEWLMKFFWLFMTPLSVGIVYLVIHSL